MDALPEDLRHAALAARERLTALSRATAVSASGGAMASAAREAIFADALTAAMHARLEELKGVAK